MPPWPARHLLAAVGVALLISPSAADAAKKRTHRPHVAAHHAAPIPHPAAYRPAAAGSQTVVFGDRVIGADPDPRIRHELLRDLGAVFGGAD